MMQGIPERLTPAERKELHRILNLSPADLQEEISRAGSGAPPDKPPIDNPRRPGDDGRMEKRIEALETANIETRDRLARIETKLDSFVTKADLHEALHSLTWKIVGSCTLLVGAVFYIARHVH